MSTKENVMPLTEKSENQNAVIDAKKSVSSNKEASKHIISKPGLQETKVNQTKIRVAEEKPASTIIHKKEEIVVYTPETSRRSPSPHSFEQLRDYPESKIKIHHRKEPNFLQSEPSIATTKDSATSKAETVNIKDELQQAIKQKEELVAKIQSASKELTSKKQQALEIKHKLEQMTKYRASIELNKKEMAENLTIFEELSSILETANEKGLHFDEVLAKYDDEINSLLDELSLTKYDIEEFKESHSQL
ncbi:hypothetical protein [Parasitella parasitica]|uniref:Uncharacterized protein n=1 Tax=Parasitella parasitica TaxID=35722 RepID=A0A0B7NJH3_9FUNG|nr:hypothetical protein [Parasitella parasitica]